MEHNAKQVTVTDNITKNLIVRVNKKHQCSQMTKSQLKGVFSSNLKPLKKASNGKFVLIIIATKKPKEKSFFELM